MLSNLSLTTARPSGKKLLKSIGSGVYNHEKRLEKRNEEITEKVRRETKFLLKQATIGNFKNFEALLHEKLGDAF